MFRGCRTFVAAYSIVFAAETHTIIPIQVATYTCYSHVYLDSMQQNLIGTLALWNPLIYCSGQRAKCQNTTIFRCAAPPKAGQGKRISWSCRLPKSRFAEQIARQNLQIGKWLQLVVDICGITTCDALGSYPFAGEYRFRVFRQCPKPGSTSWNFALFGSLYLPVLACASSCANVYCKTRISKKEIRTSSDFWHQAAKSCRANNMDART